jgi:hypothetical protein
MKLKELELTSDLDQEFYDSFNPFILNQDNKIFGKSLARIVLYIMVREDPDDIVELGVSKGAGVLTFLKLKRFLSPNSSKK